MARILGLDIDHDVMRGVLLRTSFRNVEVQRYIQIPLAAEPDTPGRAPELADAYQNLLKTLESPPDTVIASMDGRQLSLHSVELPAAAAKRIGDILPFELESLVPFDPDDAVIAHQPMLLSEGQLRLLVAAALEERVEATLQALQSAGIDPDELGAGCVALDGLAGMLGETLGEGSQLLLEVRRDTTDLCFLQDGRCQQARSLSVGYSALERDADHLWQEIRRSIATARANGVEAPQALHLIGEGALADGMGSWLTRHLDLDVSVPELPASTAGPAPGATFGRALALAARTTARGAHINMRAGRFASTRSRVGLAAHGNLIAGCAVAILLSGIFALNASHSLLLDDQQRLETSLAETTKEILGRAAPTAEAAEALLATQSKKRDPLPRFDAFDALDAVSASIDQGIRHEVKQLRIEVGDDKRAGRVEIQGELASLEQRDTLVAALQSQGCFTELDKGRTRPSRDKSRINYQIEADLDCGSKRTSKKKK